MPSRSPRPIHWDRSRWVSLHCSRFAVVRHAGRLVWSKPPASDGAAIRFSIVEVRGVALRLDVAAALLAFQPSLLRAEGRLGGAPRYRPYHGFAQDFEQAVDGVGAVAFLGAEALGVDHDHAFLGHALAGNPVQPERGV